VEERSTGEEDQEERLLLRKFLRQLKMVRRCSYSCLGLTPVPSPDAMTSALLSDRAYLPDLPSTWPTACGGLNQLADPLTGCVAWL
jgi:hypothetical protein